MNEMTDTGIDPASLAEAITARSAEAALGRLRLSSAPLREHLRMVLSRRPGEPGALLASPVLEAAFGYETAPETLGALVGEDLLHPETVSALAETAPLDRATREGRNTLGHDVHPYTHQLAAWRALAREPARSVVVSSGTGSGKTEAFLLPIFDSLAREAVHGRVLGVRALLLYPLNALIASQRDRLADWTAPFDGRLRFCLYNGETAEQLSAAERRLCPYEAVDRTQLRAEPPPILVTNATMLEYMLVRDKDAPILDASRGKLRWIVLDEAHTYLGSQAAEMTLLLRRTLHAFGVTPEQVRFVATSATLGGDDVEAPLRTFLARMAGVPESRIDVVLGRRFVPPLEGFTGGVGADRVARDLREQLAREPATLDELRQRHPGTDVDAVLRRATASAGPGGPFLPLRLHLFHRAQAGVFACVDPACAGRAGTALGHPGWAFGAVYERDCARCCACKGRVFELWACKECGLTIPGAAMDATGDQLGRWREVPSVDEFAADAETPEPDEDEEPDPAPPSDRVVLVADGFDAGVRIALDPKTGRLHDRAGPGLVRCRRADARTCPGCGAGRAGDPPFRPLRLGGPFFMGVVGNVLLDAMPARAGGPRLPEDGRQLLAFTDNRQGTARFAARWQQERERSFARARIWHCVQQREVEEDPDLADKIKSLEAVPNPPPALQAYLHKLRADSASREAGKPVSWTDMRECLAGLNAAEPELLRLWEDREAEVAGPEDIARLQLLTEFLRRPRHANSLETMGLAALRFPALERQSEAHLPPLFRRHGATAEDWRDYLHIVLTYFVRANSAVSLTDRQALWLGQKVWQRRFLPWGVRRDPEWGDRRWPRLGGSSGRAVRPVLLLRDAFGLDLERPDQREEVNEVLEAVWRALSPVSASGLPDGAFQIDLTRAEIAPVVRAWLCPVTGRLMERVFRGMTPYVTRKPQSAQALACAPLVMPRLPLPWLSRGADARAATAEWLRTDLAVAALRARGLWTDIADRLALLAPFARIVEHSAQQPSARLREYESRFKRGEINVLNCSTTMEMGVDIGGIAGIAMANVPPSPANYRQRVGRAGRRGERISVAFTYCGDLPIGWHSFDRPGEPLRQAIAPPRVALESEVLSQRHANAMLLSAFLRQRGAQPLSLTAGAFFDHAAPEGVAPWRRFAAWLSEAAADLEMNAALRFLLAGTGLAASSDVAERTKDAIEAIGAAWIEERAQLQQDLEVVGDGAARKAVDIQCKRMDGEFLLGELARQAFLPGHGFPTDVVPFVTPPRDRAPKGNPREDSGARWRGYPTRKLDIALREYAPGADIVLDGTVYRSGGVTLNWKRPASNEAVAEIQALRWFWRCRGCDAAGDETRRPDRCPACVGDRLDRVRALRPAGFAADADVPRTNALDWIEPVPFPEPLVSARGAAWVALADPAVGRYRHAPDGLVMAVSRGTSGHGYAVCLACGRAAPEVSAEGAALPSPMSGHRSLRRGLRCEGATRPFAIQRRLALGQSRRTEVFELQLTGLDETCGATIAVALREALCRRLGIERDEVARAVAPAPGEAATTSLFLFDTASGGAGYAGAAATDLPGLLRGARAVLDCTNPGCERACPACLILRDTARHADALDRKRAAAWLDPFLAPLERAEPQPMKAPPLT